MPRQRKIVRIAASLLTALTLAVGITSVFAGPASPSRLVAKAQAAVVTSIQPAQNFKAMIHAQAITAAPAFPRIYTVQPGDTLGAIARSAYGSFLDWTFIWKANERKIGSSSTVIYVGERIMIPVRRGKPPAGPQPPPAPATPITTTTVSAAQFTVTGPWPGGAFGNCVVMRESGGNPQIMNASGHYGLYQFSASTWAAYGGNPADFGHASVQEQEQIFMNALAAGGESNWAPYDGC